MKDIPVFPTEYGVASLFLKEIPYSGHAYIQIQDAPAETTPQLLTECVGFCKACGAERFFYSGGPEEEEPAFAVLKMSGCAWVDPKQLAHLFPVTEQTVAQWRKIYNERMATVPHSRTLSFGDEREILRNVGAYFVHRDGTLLGIGWLEDTHLLAVASVVKGAGEQVMHTLMSLVEGAQMTLEVSSQNEKALDLYRRLGFLTTGISKQWYEFCEDDK